MSTVSLAVHILIFIGARRCPAGAIVAAMNGELRMLLRRHRGVLTRTDARTAHVSHLVDYAIRAGQLEAVYHGVYAAKPVDDRVRRRAALVYCRGRAAISHTTALDAWLLRRP